MNRYEFKLPDIGEGVTEGEIVKWHVKPGDVVREDQPLVDVMTDKATVGITCPKAGTVTEVHGKEGQVVYDLRKDFGAEPAALREAYRFYFDAFDVKIEVR